METKLRRWSTLLTVMAHGGANDNAHLSAPNLSFHCSRLGVLPSHSSLVNLSQSLPLLFLRCEELCRVRAFILGLSSQCSSPEPARSGWSTKQIPHYWAHTWTGRLSHLSERISAVWHKLGKDEFAWHRWGSTMKERQKNQKEKFALKWKLPFHHHHQVIVCCDGLQDSLTS